MEVMLITALLSVILVAATTAASTAASTATSAATSTAAAPGAKDHENEAGVTIRMPGVRPTRPDSYLCTGLKLGEAPTRVIGYEPLVDKGTAHHMMLFSCAEPASEAPVWDCGGMEKAGGIRARGPCAFSGFIIYAWANKAKPLQLPHGVGLKLPANITIVLQVHYNNVDNFVKGETTDDSGVRLLTTEAELAKLAAVYLVGTGGTVPKYSVTYLENSCRIKLPDGQEMHPFAFGTHTHKLGRVVSGYRVRGGNWTEIGRGNPRRPQTLYDLTGPKNMVIRDGDFVAARCTMFNRHNTDVLNGNADDDEMCNFYMVFWVHGELPPIKHQCWPVRPVDPWASKPELKSLANAPPDASKQPPLGPDEEEVKQDPPKNADRLDRRGTLSENDPNFVLQTEDGGKFYINAHRNIKTPANSNH